MQLGAGIGAVAHAVEPYHQGIAAAAAGGLIVFIVKGVVVHRGADTAFELAVQVQIALALGLAPGAKPAAEAKGEARKHQYRGHGQHQGESLFDISLHIVICP